MVNAQVQQERIRDLNDLPGRSGRYVLYWMQQSQRAECNHALEFAAQQANELRRPLVVVFGLMGDYPGANRRHYLFMLQGLEETRRTLKERGIRFVIRLGRPDAVALDMAQDASMVVCDAAYLRHQKRWRREVARRASCRVCQVEADVVVPVEVASDKSEYAARTIRPKIQRRLDAFLKGLPAMSLERDSLGMRIRGPAPAKPEQWLEELGVEASAPPVARFFTGGTGEAIRRLRDFIQHGLAGYATRRRELTGVGVSELGPYLHFGQIAPLQIALEVRASRAGSKDDREAFLEELIIRRELACNYAHFTSNYDAFDALPAWARKTLAKHAGDAREHVYTLRQLEAAKTHDRYWNAAMSEMRATGYLHNHLRMYWGKKILEWSASPEKAFRSALALNNKYFLDGRDANSFANVAWLFGLHDRPWGERPIFGTVRYMSAEGLERKCDMAGYLEHVDALLAQQREECP